MSSTSAVTVPTNLTVTFDIGTDLDMAQVLVQNRVAIAEPRLPEEVKKHGITTKKKSTNIIVLITLTSPDECFMKPVLEQFRHPADQRSAGRITVSGTWGFTAQAITACASGWIPKS